MEQPREQQAPGGPAPLPYMPPQQPYQQAASIPAPRRPSAWRMFTTFLRLILRRFIYAIVWLLRPLRRYAGFAVVVVALLGVIGWMAGQIWGPQMAAPPDPRVAALAPAPAVENYITGRKSFDANLMWEAFSTDYQAQMLQDGGSKATMEALARQEKRLGLQYRNIRYIGGVERDVGGHFYYYSIDVAYQNGSIRLPVVFAADSEEKIEYIISPLDNIIQRLMQN